MVPYVTMFWNTSDTNFLRESQESVARGDNAGKSTAHKVLRVGLWWPLIFHDAKQYCKTCNVC